MIDDPQQAASTDTLSLQGSETEVHQRTLQEFAPQVELTRRILTFVLRVLGNIGPVTLMHDARSLSDDCI